MILKVEQLIKLDSGSFVTYNNEIVQIIGYWVNYFEIKDHQLQIRGYQQLEHSISQFYYHNKQLLYSVKGGELFYVNFQQYTSKKIDVAISEQIIDALIQNQKLILLTQKYIKIYGENNKIEKSIEFAGQKIEASNSIIVSYQQDKLLIIDASKSKLYELHKFINLQQQDLIIKQVAVLKDIVIVTESNFLLIVSIDFKILKIKQMIIKVHDFQANRQFLLLNCQDQHLILNIHNFEIISQMHEKSQFYLTDDAIISISDNQIFKYDFLHFGINECYSSLITPIEIQKFQPGEFMISQTFQIKQSVTNINELIVRTIGYLNFKNIKFVLQFQCNNDQQQIQVMLYRDTIVIQKLVICEDQVLNTEPLALYLINQQYYIVLILCTQQIIITSMLDNSIISTFSCPVAIPERSTLMFDENKICFLSDSTLILWSYDISTIIKKIYQGLMNSFNNFPSLQTTCTSFQSSSSEFE